jgi:HK97 family phage portal protein
VHVAKDGRVYYRLADDKLAGIPDGDEVYAPASEIIHDRMWCLFHPLIGLSPIFANALAASQGLKIQENSAVFFGNMSRPSGTLTAPGFLTNEQADIYKQRWHDNYGPGKQGQTAILGSGLKYEAMTQTAEDSQLVEQLKMSAEMICSTFHVPCYKVGVGPMPPYQSAAILDQIYYDCCLQTLIKGIESGLDDGLGLGNGSGRKLRVKLDLDDLLAMDEGGLTDVLVKQAGAGIASPNEQRKRLNLAPVKGGESPKIQQQNYSLEAIDARDRGPDPFGTAKPPAPALPDSPDTPDKALEQMIARHVETMVAFRAEFVAIEQKRVEAEARETARRLEAEAKEAERIARVAEESARVEKSAREAAEALAEQRHTEAEERRLAEERARAEDEKLASFLKTFRAMCEDESA